MSRAVTDMPDRELLELAAVEPAAQGAIRFDPWREVFRHVGATGFLLDEWNPLGEDADAFRLAADLDLFALPEYWSMLARVRLLGGTDKYANVRRALVWTAVERHLEKKARKPVPA